MRETISSAIIKSTKLLKPNKTQFNLLVLHEHTKSLEKLELVEERNQEKKKKKSTWVFLLFNILIVGGILTYTLLTQETKPISELLSETPYWGYLFLGLLAMVAFYFIRAVGYAFLFYKTTGTFKLGRSIKVAIVGKYWDSITPTSSGGQFAQIAYLNKKGEKGQVSTSVIVSGHMLWQIAFIIVGLIVIISPVKLYTGGQVIRYLALAGVSISILFFAFLLMVSLSKKMCAVFVVGGLKLLTKMKIVKDYEKALYKSLLFIRHYQKSIRAVAKSPIMIVGQVLINVVSLLLVASVDYFIYKTFNPYGTIPAMQILAMSFLCTFATSIFIVPGGSGAAEISYMAMFSKLFTEGTTFWALMFWRILTYYLYIIVGFIQTIVETFTNRKKIRIENIVIHSDKKSNLVDKRGVDGE